MLENWQIKYSFKKPRESMIAFTNNNKNIYKMKLNKVFLFNIREIVKETLIQHTKIIEGNIPVQYTPR